MLNFILYLFYSDKRALIAIRLQGGLPRLVGVLQDTDCASTPKVLKSMFELLDMLMKSSINAPTASPSLSARSAYHSNCILLFHKLRAVPLLCSLVKSLVPSSYAFSQILKFSVFQDV
jgi:hypothetical protein